MRLKMLSFIILPLDIIIHRIYFQLRTAPQSSDQTFTKVYLKIFLDFFRLSDKNHNCTVQFDVAGKLLLLYRFLD